MAPEPTDLNQLSNSVDPEVYAGGGAPKGPRKGGTSGRKSDKEQAGSSSNTIVLFGRMRELALYRAEVLQTRGFSVIAPESKAEAIAAISDCTFDALVLSYTLSSETVEELTEVLRQKCPGIPLITISDTGKIDPRLRPDRTVLAHEGPAALIKALRQVLMQQ